MHAAIARYILEECVNKGYAIRGAITFGEYNTKNNIMIGPGIDECASWHELCNWIGVHLTPSAELLINLSGQKELNGIIESKRIPIKSGFPKASYCVKWEIEKRGFMNLTKRSKALLPEISGKHLNTYDFLYGEVNENGKNVISQS